MPSPIFQQYQQRQDLFAMGRYTSRDDEKQEMIDHLNKMMMNARTPEERESYRSAIEHMSRN